MEIVSEIKKIASEISAEVKENGSEFSLESVIAERKSFFSRKKLIYKAKITLNQEKKELKFSEMLKESGFGLSMGSANDEMTPGFGFKKETYKVGFDGQREGSIEEQSNLFGNKYDYKFDYKIIRKKIEEIANSNGYKFVYSIF